MSNIVYLDVLIILNIYVSFFLFLGSGKILGEKIKKWRLFCASLIGGVFSLLILFEISVGFQLFIKFAMGILLVLIAFPFKSLKYIIKCTFVFFLINFIYGGFMFALWFFIAPSGMVYKNGVVYFNISALSLVISTITAYILISGVCLFLNKRTKPIEKVPISISFCGRNTEIVGLCDTGNKLCDAFSGLPVVVCEYQAVSTLLPQTVKNYCLNPFEVNQSEIENTSYISKLRIVPVEVVGATSMLPAFKPDEIQVSGVEKQAIVAITNTKLSDGEFQAIINVALIS